MRFRYKALCFFYIWNHAVATTRSIGPCLNTAAGLARGDSSSDLVNWCNFVCGLCWPNLPHVCLVGTCKFNTVTPTDVNQLEAGRARTGSCAEFTVLVLRLNWCILKYGGNGFILQSKCDAGFVFLSQDLNSYELSALPKTIINYGLILSGNSIRGARDVSRDLSLGRLLGQVDSAPAGCE